MILKKLSQQLISGNLEDSALFGASDFLGLNFHGDFFTTSVEKNNKFFKIYLLSTSVEFSDDEFFMSESFCASYSSICSFNSGIN